MSKNHGNIGIVRTYSWLMRFLRPHIKWFVVGMSSLAILIIFNLTKVFFIDRLINSAVYKQYYEALYTVLFVIFSVLIGSIASFGSKYAFEKLSALVGGDLREKALGSISKAPIKYIEKSNSGDMASVINNEIESIQEFMKGSFKQLIFQPVMCICAFIYMMIINWQLTLVSFLFTPIALFATHQLSKKMGKLSNEYYSNLGEANSFVNDSIRGMDIIKSYCVEGHFLNKCSKSFLRSFKNGIRIDRYDAYMTPFIIMLFEFPRIFCIAYGGWLSFNGYISPGSLIAFFQMLAYIIDPSTSLPNLLGDVRKIEGIINRVTELLNLPSERSTGIKFDINECDTVIEFSGIDFSYDGSNKILKNLSFKINQNNIVALVGSSGSGKSTIFNLTCGFYEPQKGCIKLFGRDIKEWNLPELRELISLVSQQVVFFPGTIAENIAFGRQDATMDEIIKASKEANAHEFIINMNQGYNTEIGQDGAGISGGQKQRISIARALIKNSPIILLDEPTSSLDLQSEILIQETLERIGKERTIFVIAHRLTTIKQASDIFVLNNGCIEEHDTHEQLINKDGLYKKLYYKQFLSYDNAEERGA